MVSDGNERADRLIDRLGTPLASERVAADRNWSAISARLDAPVRGQGGFLRSVLATVAVAALIAIAATTWGSVRLQVGANHLPVLYRQEVARTELVAPGVTASLAIEQKPAARKVTPAAPEGVVGLFVSALVDVRINASALPADIELRFQRPEWGSYGILARTEGLNDPRRSTGETRTLYDAPFPPSLPGETVTYRVWLHLETATGPLDSRVLEVAVTVAPEGQRAALVGERPVPSAARSVQCAEEAGALGGVIKVCPSAGTIGSTVNIEGRGCNNPGGPAIIYFGREFGTAADGLTPGATEVGRFPVDDAGHFSGTFRIPSELGTIQGAGGGPLRAGVYGFYSKPSAFCRVPFTVSASVQ